MNKNLGYPEVQRGRSAPLPSYDPLIDPHLTEYFERRFGAIQSVARVRLRSKLFYFLYAVNSIICIML